MSQIRDEPEEQSKVVCRKWPVVARHKENPALRGSLRAVYPEII